MDYYELNGITYTVTGEIEGLPIIPLPMMTDERWEELTDESMPKVG